MAKTTTDEDASAMEFMTGDEVLAAYVARCAPHGKVQRAWLFCHQEQPDETLCMLDMTSGAKNAAAAVGGWAYDTTVCVRQPLSAAFSCRFRSDGRIFVRSCDECRVPREEWLGRGAPPGRALDGG